jgi:hypothetical protein
MGKATQVKPPSNRASDWPRCQVLVWAGCSLRKGNIEPTQEICKELKIIKNLYSYENVVGPMARD